VKLLGWILRGAGFCKKHPAPFSALEPIAEETDMWLFAGLGNPGAKYRTNRHNVGFMVVETIAQKYETFGPFRSKFDGEISEGKIGRTKILLLKPQTFMNLSGQSVVKVAHFYKIMPERIIVFHDELDLPPGEVRVKKGGGNAGHNGLKSLQESLSTPDFWRVRIGIGRPPVKGADVSNYVLGDFSEQDKEWLEEKLEKMSAQVSDLMSGNPALYEKNLKPKSPEVKLETNKKDEKNGL
jgi:PTH1 family peptidyl-tRNA hydrolase